jgi:hypothetical protein
MPAHMLNNGAARRGGIRKYDFSNDLKWVKIGFVGPLQKIIKSYFPDATWTLSHNGSSLHKRHQWDLTTRVSVCHTPANRASVAHLSISHQPDRFAQKRQVPSDDWISRERHISNEGPNANS